MGIHFSKKILSFFYPITIKKVVNNKNQNIFLQLYRNQWMLSTNDAIYSFGTFYTPFRQSFKKIKKEIASIDSFLLLGTGLGSALKILQTKYHIFPKSTLVDNDKNIIDLSVDYMNLNSKKNVEWVCSDAISFLENNNKKFDLIGIDVFYGMLMPKDYKQEIFFKICSESLNKNGYCIFNMILNSSNEKMIIAQRLASVFSSVLEINFKQNTFFICKY